MNVSEYREAVRLAVGLAPQDAVLTDETCLWALNGALSTIATDKDWPWHYTEEAAATVEDQPTIPLPANHTRTVFIVVDENEPLQTSTHIELSYDRETTGVPRAYAAEANDIRLWPIPDDAYDVIHAFYRSEPALLADTDTPLLPDAYSERLVLEAAIKVAVRTNNLSRLTTLREALDVVRKSMGDNYVRMNKPGRILRTKESVWQQAVV
jgi:hypothetical protein